MSNLPIRSYCQRIQVLPALLMVSFVMAAGPATRPFQDVTQQMGLTLPNAAAAWGDLENDGWVDLYVSGTLWRNGKGGQFSSIEGHGLAGGMGLWGDFDNDGRPDLYCCDNGRLYRNVDGKRFEDVTGRMPQRPMQTSRGGVWGDFNNDGFLDLYVGGWEEPNYQPDAVFLSKAGASFELAWKTTDRMRPARGVTAGDFDADGDLDVYVSNYRLEQNLLWRNTGNGTFDEVAIEYAVAGDYGAEQAWGHTIGSAFGDLDNDGFLDLFVGNFSHKPSYCDRPQFLRNLGPAGKHHFQDRSAGAGLAWQESFASPTLGDFDNDGLLDLFFTTVYSGDHSVLYRNNGDWTFTDVTKQAGFGTLQTYQAAWADFDNDGNLDLVSGGRLFRNPGSGHHWLKVRLEGGGPVNRSAIGAVVRVRLADRILTRQVEGAVGECNQNDLTLHFGLGDHAGPVELEIAWPGGKVQRLSAPIDRLVSIKYQAP